jgi:hypothetical protein
MNMTQSLLCKFAKTTQTDWSNPHESSLNIAKPYSDFSASFFT